jgi:hypothetical protein
VLDDERLVLVAYHEVHAPHVVAAGVGERQGDQEERSPANRTRPSRTRSSANWALLKVSRPAVEKKNGRWVAWSWHHISTR